MSLLKQFDEDMRKLALYAKSDPDYNEGLINILGTYLREVLAELDNHTSHKD